MAILVLPYIVSASPAFNNLQQVGSGGDSAPYQASSDINSLAGIVSIVIQAFLGLLGIIFISYLLYAGYHWMTAQGDEKKVDKAKETIQRAITGLIIIVAAYAISIFVVGRLEAGTLNGGGGGTTAPSAPSADPDRFNDPDAT